MSNVPRRDGKRPSFSRSSGPSSADIMADIARRASLPKNDPDYAAPDIDVDYDQVVRPAPGVEKPGFKAKKKK